MKTTLALLLVGDCATLRDRFPSVRAKPDRTRGVA
jgi:hypothetical protein